MPHSIDGVVEVAPSKEIFESTTISPPHERPSGLDQSSGRSSIEPELAEPVFRPGRSFALAFVAICTVTLAAALDSTSLSIALSTVTARLHGTAIEGFWAGTAYVVASGVFQPVAGSLSYVFGRKQIVLVAALFFAVGSLVAALSKNFTMLLVARSIQGIGAGGIFALGEILVTDLVPLAVRGSWIGFYSGMYAIGTVGGPLIGGGFAQMSYSGWRWIYWINLPMIGIGTAICIFCLKVNPLEEDLVSRLRSFDYIGIMMFIASVVSFLVSISWGGVMFAWDSWHTLVPLFLGLAGMIAFGIYEYTLLDKAFDSNGDLLPGNNVQPIIRFSIFGNWTLRVVYFQTFIHGVVLWGLLYFLPLYYEGVKGYKPVISAVAVFPETFLISVITIGIGIVISITKQYRWAIWGGWAITILGLGLLHLLDASTSIVAFIFLNIPVSIGTGMNYTSMGIAIQAAGRPQDAGHSIVFYSFIRVFGQAVGVAIGGVIFQNQIVKQLSHYPLLAPKAEEYSREVTSLVSLIRSMNDGLEKTQLVQAFADSLKVIWVVMAALSAAAFVSTFFMKAYSLDQEHKPHQRLIDDETKKDA